MRSSGGHQVVITRSSCGHHVMDARLTKCDCDAITLVADAFGSATSAHKSPHTAAEPSGGIAEARYGGRDSSA